MAIDLAERLRRGVAGDATSYIVGRTASGISEWDLDELRVTKEVGASQLVAVGLQTMR